jgi:mRNA-degrading endonuclease RelE of RelBE toxin-antitoxin system
MSRSEFNTGYIVEISAPAWEELARLPLERYQRVRNELEALASRLLMGPSPSAFAPEEARPTSFYLRVEDCVARYRVDREGRRLMLLEVSQGLPSKA